MGYTEDNIERKYMAWRREDERMRRQLLWFFGLMLGVVLGIAIAVDCFAEVRVRGLHARGFGNLPQVQAERLLSRACSELTKETGVHIRLRRFESRKAPCESLMYNLDYDNRLEILWCHKRWFGSKGARADARVAITQPVYDPTSMYFYLAGMAESCKQGGTAWAAVMEANEGQYRIPQSYIAIKHELTHQLGARGHREQTAYGCNLMDPNAMAYGCSQLIPQSVADVQRCAGRW